MINVKIAAMLVTVFIMAGCSKVLEPELPLKYSFRESAIQNGKVLVIENPTDKFFSLKIDMWNNTHNEHQTHSIDVPSWQTTEVGWMELDGWRFITGERVRLENDGFRPAEIIVP